MEFSLHRELKEQYAEPGAQLEAPLEGYRIDVLNRNHVVEIQHGGLAAIREKVTALLQLDYRVTVVKPIVAHKLLVKLRRRGGRVVGRRRSPKRGCLLDLFDELVHFTQVFPHPNLTLEVPLVEIEEWRYPGHGRRRRRRASDYQISDQRLLAIRSTQSFRHGGDLLALLPEDLSPAFDTRELAQRLSISRWLAQRIAYCLRHSEAVQVVGRRRSGVLYRIGPSRAA